MSYENSSNLFHHYLSKHYYFAIIGGVAHIISNLIHLGNPELLSVVGLMIQFYIFGITLQLYREFAGSLWANMLFHLVCLETVRFVFMSSSQSIIKFHETQQGVFGIIGLFLGLYIGSAIILSILLWLRKESPKIKSIIRRYQINDASFITYIYYFSVRFNL